MPAHTDLSAVDDDLHRLLLRATPPDLSGDVTLTHMAQLLGLSRNAPYKWLVKGRIPAQWAVALVRLSRGTVTLTEFHPHVYGIPEDEVLALSRETG